MRILIAPNAFKHSLDARAAADAIALGLQRSRLECQCQCFPVGDGGDGTAALLMRHFSGRRVAAVARDPLGRTVTAQLGVVDAGGVAVIELAEASGLRLLQPSELDPLRANSYGTGELIRAALDQGVRHIILAVGGSASIDGGAGLLQALGVRLLDSGGHPLPAEPGAWADLQSLDLSGLDPRATACRFTALCDVENAILGAGGAAPVFGPQKGASPAVVERLQGLLSRWCQVLLRQTGRHVADLPRGGAAGGVAAGLHAVLNADVVSGIDYFLDTTDFDRALQTAQLVITGEGCIDAQTMQGKAPFGVAQRARARGVRVLALAGQVPAHADARLSECFEVLLPIGRGPGALDGALARTREDLERTACQLGNALNAGAEAGAGRLPS